MKIKKHLTIMIFSSVCISHSVFGQTNPASSPQLLHRCGPFMNHEGLPLIGAKAPSLSAVELAPKKFQYFVTTEGMNPSSPLVQTPVSLVRRTIGGFGQVWEVYTGGPFTAQLFFDDNGERLVSAIISIGDAESNCSWPL